MNCRILVVDDDRTVRNSIAEYLSDLGYLADMAEDAKTAVTKMKTYWFDIVVMEVNLPRYWGGYSGLFLLGYIHQRYPGIKTIVVTGDVAIESGLESILMGASCWLTKPFSLINLKNEISDIIRSQNVHTLPKRQNRNRLNC